MASSEIEDGHVTQLMSYINDNIIGRDKHFLSPFGARKYVYCDYTASGRSLKFIEDYIQNEVLPDYGNTHTTTTVTAFQTTLFRHEARDILRNNVNASEYDAVLFTGSGSTGAIQKIIHSMDLHAAPVVFVSLHEHHSNLLPWRELSHKVITIEETLEGQLNQVHLEHELKVWKSSGRPMIGSFIAASNVSGVLENTAQITEMLHRYGALSFWDYATAAPYVKIDMNPVQPGLNPALTQKDALFFSPHKFVGGVQTPGILIAKRQLFRVDHPLQSGGGTVFFVSRTRHRYHKELELREEAGTPAIVESIRAGIVMQLKESVGCDAIQRREHYLTQKTFDTLTGCANLILLGPARNISRLPVFTFVVKHEASGYLVHHNYICTLLNDLFGIQFRGGCMCAGPYGMELLGINEELAYRYEKILEEDDRLDRVHLRRHAELSDMEIIKPGHSRLSLTYFMSDEEIDFVLKAITMVAEHGWKLLPQYKFNTDSGEWTHHAYDQFDDRKWLSWLNYKQGHLEIQPPAAYVSGQEKAKPLGMRECFEAAEKIFNEAAQVAARMKLGDQRSIFDKECEELRWFLLPSEAVDWLTGKAKPPADPSQVMPFHPTKYPKTDHKFKEPWSKCLCLNSKEELCSVHSSNAMTQPPNPVCKWRAGRSATGRSNDSLMQPKYQDTKPITKAKDSFQDTFVRVLSKNYIIDQASIERFDAQKSQDQAGCSTHVEASCSNNKSWSLGAHDPKQISVGTEENHFTEANKERPEFASNNKTDQSCDQGSCSTQKTIENANNSSSGLSEHKVTLWHIPPKHIFKPTLEALNEYNMVKNGDKVLICLSGGKDSLSLLHTLHQYQFYAKSKGIHFSLGAVTVDPEAPSYDPSPLKAYLKQLQVPYFYEKQGILQAAQDLPYQCASICSFCSRMKRGRLYHAARREGYNVLAMGQHLDDLAETFLMSAFYNGIIHTMKAAYSNKDGDLRIIRPFVYVREKDLRAFAEQNGLPIIPENCPACFQAPKERHRMKQVLAAQEVKHPQLFNSLQSALRPLMAINQTNIRLPQIVGQVLKSVGNMSDPEQEFQLVEDEEDE